MQPDYKQLAVLQLCGLNARGGNLAQQDAIGISTQGKVPDKWQLWQHQTVAECMALNAEETLLVVADGVSSNPAAALASKTVVHYLLQQWQKTPFSSKQLRAAQSYLADTLGAKRQSFGAATTIAALAIKADRFIAINAGDSRVWRLREEQLQQLSVDHTFQNDSPELQQQDNLAQCYQAITSYLAADHEESDFAIAVSDGALLANDAFLITSDGVHDVLTPQELSAFMLQSDMSLALEKMHQLLLARGAPDNASLLWLRLGLQQEN